MARHPTTQQTGNSINIQLRFKQAALAMAHGKASYNTTDRKQYQHTVEIQTGCTGSGPWQGIQQHNRQETV